MNRISPLIAALPLILLAACARQEPVGNLPDDNAIAAAVNAAAAPIAEAKPVDRIYVDPNHGFSVTMPEGWIPDTSADNADGVVYKDPGAGADVRVFWQANANDQDLQQIVEAVNDGSDSVEGDFRGDNEYRGSATDGEGNAVVVRLLKQADGSIVTATFVYPEMLGEQYRPIAQQVLDSLKLGAPAKAESAAEGGNSAAR